MLVWFGPDIRGRRGQWDSQVFTRTIRSIFLSQRKVKLEETCSQRNTQSISKRTAWIWIGGAPKDSLNVSCQMQYRCIGKGLVEMLITVASGRRVPDEVDWLSWRFPYDWGEWSTKVSDYWTLTADILMCTWKISCVATLQNPSIVFWDWISLCTCNTTVRIYQAVFSLILNMLIQIFKKTQHIYGKNNQPLRPKKKRTNLPLYRRFLKPNTTCYVGGIVQRPTSRC